MLVAARLSVASSSGVDAAVRRWPIRPSIPARSWHTAMQSSIFTTLAKITAVVGLWSGMGVGLVAGPGEGGVGLGRNGSDWAQFGPRGSREVAFGRAWA